MTLYVFMFIVLVLACGGAFLGHPTAVWLPTQGHENIR